MTYMLEGSVPMPLSFAVGKDVSSRMLRSTTGPAGTRTLRVTRARLRRVVCSGCVQCVLFFLVQLHVYSFRLSSIGPRK